MVLKYRTVLTLPRVGAVIILVWLPSAALGGGGAYDTIGLESAQSVPIVYIINKTIHQVNCNARITCTNSSGVKPDLGLDQDQQCIKAIERPVSLSIGVTKQYMRLLVDIEFLFSG